MRPGIENASKRRAAVAGLFYPDDPVQLRESVDQYLRTAPRDYLRPPPKALIVPHAGYIYSGSVAASAYAAIETRRDEIRRVVLIGPSHRVPLHGIAAPRADVFETPLGTVPIDREWRAMLIASGEVMSADAPHAQEHCLEVQLPFLQSLLSEFVLLPLVAGDATPEHVGSVLDRVWGDRETLVLISSDLSHYHSYETALRIDAATSDLIRQLSPTLSGEQACGSVCINGLLFLAKQRRMQLHELSRMNSGDTAGDRRRVVGYGAFAVATGES
ncbi:MAG TPA: AmmeMemoRadiSam system protein B [Povalibacter sp.]